MSAIRRVGACMLVVALLTWHGVAGFASAADLRTWSPPLDQLGGEGLHEDWGGI